MGISRIRYNTGVGMLKVKEEDDTGAYIQSWVIMMNEGNFNEWVRIMRKKYGFKSARKENEDDIKKDLDWAM